MTASNIISRVARSCLYHSLVCFGWAKNAKAANGLFNMGYNIHALFLIDLYSRNTRGDAKQTARYNSLNEYGTSRRLFIRALLMMGGLGLLFALFMYIASFG